MYDNIDAAKAMRGIKTKKTFKDTRKSHKKRATERANAVESVTRSEDVSALHRYKSPGIGHLALRRK